MIGVSAVAATTDLGRRDIRPVTRPGGARVTVRIVTDSSACLPPDLVARYGIEVVPIRVALNGADLPVVEVEPRRIIDHLLRGGRVSTSAPSPGAFLQALERSDQGDGVVLLTLAATMSSTYRSARLAVSQAAATVRLVDTGTAAGGLGLVTLAAARPAAQNASLDEVEETARRVASRVRLVAAVGSLDYLTRGGRVPGIAGRLGDALGLNPLFEFREGQVRVLRPSMSGSGARARILSQWRDSRPGGAARLHVTALHANNRDEAETLLAAVAGRIEPATAFLSEFDAAMVAHTGPDVLGLAWWWNEDPDQSLK